MWTVTIDGKSYDLSDLPPAMFQPIADRHQQSWLELYNTPAADINAYYDLVEMVAKLLDVAVPPRPATMGQVTAMLDLLSRTDNLNVDPPQGEPDQDENETTGSSTGSPDDTDGPQA